MSRTLVVRRCAGLGDILLSTAAAWRYAKATRRTLVIDWRFTDYTADPADNLFHHLFETPTDLLGVPVIVAGSNDSYPAATTMPDSWTPAALADTAHWATAEEQRQHKWACSLIADETEVTAERVVFAACTAPQHPGPRPTAQLLRALTPLPHLARALADARAELIADGPVIGVHVRHGNGGDIMGHARFWSDGLAVQRVVESIREARAQLGATVPVLLATDSADVRDAVAAMVPGVRVMTKHFRPPGAGELHRWERAADTLKDAFVEMFLLADTTVLVRMPPTSYFSAPGAFMKSPTPRALRGRRAEGLQPAVW